MSAADSNGASDPYVTVRYGGQQAKTAVRPVTTNPIWYQTLRLTADILPPSIAPKARAVARSGEVYVRFLPHSDVSD